MVVVNFISRKARKGAKLAKKTLHLRAFASLRALRETDIR